MWLWIVSARRRCTRDHPDRGCCPSRTSSTRTSPSRRGPTSRAGVTPNLVTVITGDELVRLGARDLMDALRLLPSLEPGVDVFGGVGFGFRGSWAFEGRTALIRRRVEWNETEWSPPAPWRTGSRPGRSSGSRSSGARGRRSTAGRPSSRSSRSRPSPAATGPAERPRPAGPGSRAWSTAVATWGLASPARSARTGRLAVQGHLGQGRTSDDTYTDVYGRSVNLTDISAIDPPDPRRPVRPRAARARRRLQPVPPDAPRRLRRDREPDDHPRQRARLCLGRGRSPPRGGRVGHPEARLDLEPPVEVQRGPAADPLPVREPVGPPAPGLGDRPGRPHRESSSSSGGRRRPGIGGEIGEELPDFWLFADEKRHEDYWNVAGFGQAVGRLPFATVTAGVRVDYPLAVRRRGGAAAGRDPGLGARPPEAHREPGRSGLRGCPSSETRCGPSRPHRRGRGRRRPDVGALPHRERLGHVHLVAVALRVRGGRERRGLGRIPERRGPDRHRRGRGRAPVAGRPRPSS